MPYEPGDLGRAWKLLLGVADQLTASEAYRFDIMDIGRQVLSNLAQQLQKDMTAAFERRDLPGFDAAAQRFIDLLLDIDRLLATRDEFSLDRCVCSARSWAETAELGDYYEWNASMLVSIWGPHDNPLIFDYAWREWAGLIRLYYVPRWRLFLDHLRSVLRDGRRYRDPKRLTHGRHALRANRFYSALTDWEIAWTKTPHEVMARPLGDTVRIAQELARRWLQES